MDNMHRVSPYTPYRAFLHKTRHDACCPFSLMFCIFDISLDITASVYFQNRRPAIRSCNKNQSYFSFLKLNEWTILSSRFDTLTERTAGAYNSGNQYIVHPIVNTQ